MGKKRKKSECSSEFEPTPTPKNTVVCCNHRAKDLLGLISDASPKITVSKVVYIEKCVDQLLLKHIFFFCIVATYTLLICLFYIPPSIIYRIFGLSWSFFPNVWRSMHRLRILWCLSLIRWINCRMMTVAES